tara:strand:- start:116 stop:823 length:708 start_codon:yes stop_codon:yes gene_type:complete
MKVIVITSNHSRHREFVDTVERYTEISHVFVVQKPEGNKNFEASQKEFFGCKSRGKVKAKVINCTTTQLKSTRVKDLISEISPDICFVFGAPLLSKDIYSIPKHGCVNIHTGLVQYYRGVDSPYWAIYENNLSAIGATLHYIDSTIDGGGVIGQRKTENLSLDDTADDIFMKTCITGFDILKENMYNILNNSVDVLSNIGKGKLFQTKDMTFEKRLEIDFKTEKYLKEYLNGNNC